MAKSHISGPLVSGGKQVTDNPAIADITTDMAADANDNELKGKVNEILATLRAAGIIKE